MLEMDSFENNYFECLPDEYSTHHSIFDNEKQYYNLECEGMLIVADVSEISSQSFQPQSTFLQTSIVTENNNQDNITRSHVYPRESKNYFKNIGPKLRVFILENFSHIQEIKQNSHITDFLKVKDQKHTKKHFQSLIQSKLGLTIAKTFFKNFRWAKAFVNDNLESYFRLNFKVLEDL